MTQALRQLFERHFGAQPTVTAMLGGGSNRRFFRLAAADVGSFVGVASPNVEENRAFFSFTKTFRELGLPVPEIHAVAASEDAWIAQDLGGTNLYEATVHAREEEGGAFPASVEAAYRRVAALLPRFQVEGGRAIDFSAAYPRASFDRRSVLWDLNYFKYHFLRLAKVPFHEGRLEDDFHRFADHLLDTDTSHFLYRDFQSRNVMLVDGEPWFVDYQGGCRGALHYDVASLLYSASAGVPQDRRDALLGCYLDALEAHLPVDRDAFTKHMRSYVLVRIVQAMGAYGYRGFYERKRHFLYSVAPAVANIERLLQGGFLPVELPELRAVLERICATPELRRTPAQRGDGLTLRLGSFSYKQGYPPDEGGHGGGFVFDCRALPNPGREAAYQGLSGLDDPVRDWLATADGVGAFFEHAADLVDAQLTTYTRRGFDSLSAWFGCTGGQHRSVYLAERLALRVRDAHPQVRVALTHAQAEHWPRTAGRPEPSLSATTGAP